MRRREFITLLGGGPALLAPLPTFAQEARRTYRLGVLSDNPRQGIQFVAFFDELRRLGFVENQNLTVDGRGYAAQAEQFPALAIELAKAGVDAIVCGGPAATRAVQKATRTPIVAIVDDMVAAGLVSSLARPDGNTTGISILATELDGKRQDILMELAPNARRIVALADPNSTVATKLQTLRNAAQARGVELLVQVVDVPERIAPALDEAKRLGAAAVNVLASPLLNARRRDVFEHVAALRLPAIYQWAESAEEGGLASYGPRLVQIFRQTAGQLAKILRGAKPGDLPVEQPTTFELVINIATAKAIGFDVPSSLALRADKVIE